MNAILLALALFTQAVAADPSFEGDWYVSDTTDNNTGRREVYAFSTHLEAGDPNYVTLKLSCLRGTPAVTVEWNNLTFPDQAVFTIGPVVDRGSEPAERQYAFAKWDAIQRSLRASPAVSSAIIAAMGSAKYTTLTAHLTNGNPTVGLGISGAPQAWDRVSRHCPVKIVQRPAK